MSAHCPKDVRWLQRFKNFKKAVAQLQKFITKPDLSELEKQGLIKSFEYTYELAWNTIKDFYEAQGETDIQGSRDAFRLAFKRGLILDGQTWMDMIKSRTLSAHTYNEEIADKLATDIRETYSPQFQVLKLKLDGYA